VNRALTKDLQGYTDESVVSTTRLGLTVRLERLHFPGGSLTLICQSTLPGIANGKALTTIEIATLAANNERLTGAQDPPKSSSGSNAPYPSLICWMTVVIRVICRDRFPRV